MTVISQQGTGVELPPIAENIFAYGDSGLPYLIGGYCASCARHYFPMPEYCSHCQGAVEAVDLGRDGVIYSHTTIRTRPPYGLPRPYSVAMIDLASVRLRIFCLLDPAQAEDFSIGQKVTLAIGPMGHDAAERPCLRPYFTSSQG